MPTPESFPIFMWFWQKLFRWGMASFIGLFMACQSPKNLIEKNHKIYPVKWEKAIHTSLTAYPELDKIRIRFREKRRITPLSTRPTLASIFRWHIHRTYLVTISSKTLKVLRPILFDSLSDSAKVGVLGHELAHISDMKRFGFRGFLGHSLQYIFNERYGDIFEYQTDSLCIAHGLGPELKVWSKEVRIKMGTTQFFQEKSKEKKRERYMNPETIQKMMDKPDTLFFLKKDNGKFRH